MIFANETEHGSDMVHLMTDLVFQIGIILFAAKFGGMLFEKLKFPSVLGELSAGILIGPYLLGKIPLPGFPDGIFPLSHIGGMPVSPELYGFATIASILLLFMAGLETDLELFLRFSVAGTLVGIGGVVFSFAIGSLTAMFFLKAGFADPRCLFMGVISTATSIGITARILSEKKKMDSPEGVTIVAGAVIDDVIGIILLSVILGITTASQQGGELSWGHIGIIGLKAIAVWLGFTVLGLIFAHKISRSLKKLKGMTSVSILSFGLALILAGIFEKAGLAMIIGAYIMGLTLSKTDLTFVVQEVLHAIHDFLVPIFFTVMGMLVNVQAFFSKEILILGLIYSLGALLAKIIGCAIPALILNFNRLGAIRIGLGMVPRGEVALIVAGIGLSYGVLDEKIFGVTIMMTLFTTLLAPPILNYVLSIDKKGTKKDIKCNETKVLHYQFPSYEITDTITAKLVDHFKQEGFFINLIDFENQIYQIRKDDIFLSMYCDELEITLETNREDSAFISTLVYETLVDLHKVVEKLKDLSKPESMKKEILSTESRKKINIQKHLDVGCIILNLKGNTKEEIIRELVDSLDKRKKLLDKEIVLTDIFEREKTMSTGLENGIATPHGRTKGVDQMSVAIGIKKEGIDFNSLDQKPSNIFIMIVSSVNVSGPHVQMLSAIANIVTSEENRRKILDAKTTEEIYQLMTQFD